MMTEEFLKALITEATTLVNPRSNDARDTAMARLIQVLGTAREVAVALQTVAKLQKEHRATTNEQQREALIIEGARRDLVNKSVEERIVEAVGLVPALSFTLARSGTSEQP